MNAKNFSDLKEGDIIYEVDFFVGDIFNWSTEKEKWGVNVDITQHKFKKLYKNMPESEWGLDIDPIDNNQWAKRGLIFGTNNPDFPNSPYIDKKERVMWFSDKDIMIQWILDHQAKEVKKLKKKIDKINKAVEKSLKDLI